MDPLKPSLLLGCLLLGCGSSPLQADEEQALLTPDPTRETTPAPKSSAGPLFRYGSKGLEFESPGGGTFLWLGLRVQARTDSRPDNLTSADDLRGDDDPEASINRGRIKGGGHVGAEWFDVYSEYDFTSNTLLDFKLTLIRKGYYGIRIGQWKTEYNRERIDSSGKQQFVERSLSNYWFTLDRQQGIGGGLRVAHGSALDSTLYAEVLAGHGRGGSFHDGDGLLMLRWQWNPHGEVLDFSQGNLKHRDEVRSAVALGFVTGDTPYTRFSSSGGGQLPGLSAGDYRLTQGMFETAWQGHGWSWQQELHLKEAEHRGTGVTRRLWGGYAQAGVFPAAAFGADWPDPLELVARLAYVDPDTDQRHDGQWETMVGANWYFAGHRNKLSTDLAWLRFDDPTTTRDATTVRWRLQWELSL